MQNNSELSYLETQLRQDLKSLINIKTLSPNSIEFITKESKNILFKLKNNKLLRLQDKRYYFYLNDRLKIDDLVVSLASPTILTLELKIKETRIPISVHLSSLE